MASEQFAVTWDNFHKNMSSGMNSLLEHEDFVDVTLAVEGRYFKAHKMVLSVCSPYFQELFKTAPCKHPIVFMKDVSYTVMSDLLQFMYQGEVQVSQENFTTFIKTAESLQIKGLSNYTNASSSQSNETEVSQSQISNPKRTQQIQSTPAPKKVRLNEQSSPTIVKTEPGIESTPALAPEQVNLKMEPFDQEHEDLSDDPLDADDTNDDDWMMEGDESQTGTSGDVLLVGEESNPSDMEEVDVVSSLIPEKSKEKYENAFNRFEQWCCANDVKTTNEDVLLTYFKEKSTTYKSSSLWSNYSMLKTMLLIKQNIDIKKYKNLLVFLKKSSVGYQAQRSEIFQREDFEKFLRDADDYTFLMMKVAMIIGVVGACTTADLTNLLMENVIDEGNFIRINLPSKKNSRVFTLTSGNIENLNIMEIIRKYINVRPEHHRFFLAYRHGKCINQPVGIHTFGTIPKCIAHFLGLQNPNLYTGHCFKRTAATLKLVTKGWNRKKIFKTRIIEVVI